jgi:hypothetical protein
MKPLAELNNTPTTPRSWILNGYGRCEFSLGYDPTVPQSQQQCKEQWFQYGNLVFIEHTPTKDEFGNTNGILPPWVGIILPPRTWDFGVVHVTAYSAESILAFRAMPHLSVKGTPRTIFKQIIDYAHAKARNIVIQAGVMDDLSMTLSDDLRTNAYDHIQKLIKDSQMDWSVTGSVNEKGNLELYANLYYSRGVNTTLSLNNNNTELQSPLMTEQGTISNHVFGYSQAQTARGRFSRESVDEESVNDYGSLQLNQVYLGKHDPTSIENAAKARIQKRGRPVIIIKRNALDRKNTFDFLDVGNTVSIKETSVGFNPDGGFGFDTTAKIISMDYNDLSNKVPLNLEVFFLDEEEFEVVDNILDDELQILLDDENQYLLDDI